KACATQMPGDRSLAVRDSASEFVESISAYVCERNPTFEPSGVCWDDHEVLALLPSTYPHDITGHELGLAHDLGNQPHPDWQLSKINVCSLCRTLPLYMKELQPNCRVRRDLRILS